MTGTHMLCKEYSMSSGDFQGANKEVQRVTYLWIVVQHLFKVGDVEKLVHTEE